MRRWRTFFLGAACLLAALALLAGWAGRKAEERAAAEVARIGGPLGLACDAVRFSWWGPLRLQNVRLAGSGHGTVTADAVEITWAMAGGADPRSHVRRIHVRGLRAAPGTIALEWPDATFDVAAWMRTAADERVRLVQGAGGTLDASWPRNAGARMVTVALDGFDLSPARVSFRGEPVLDPGRWSGHLTLAGQAERLESGGELTGEGLRVALPRTLGLGSGGYGAPTAAVLGWDVLRDHDLIEVRHASARFGGLALDGHGRLRGRTEREVDMELSGRTDLGPAFRTTGLALPAALPVATAAPLGAASFTVSVRGPLGDPAALRIEPRLQFESAPEAVRAFQFLRQPFRYTPAESPGHVILVGAGGPAFVPLGAVPPLFVRALLISEDAGFFGHPGIDVAEIPVAWAENEERGESARGASTITQQLVKNLFLSKDKSYGRKLTEAALALMLDAAVPKHRILEIYLNVIEWGPGIYGLGPAAQHYFGKSPSDLTAKEMAFLICLIPSPVRYHQAHAAGQAGPGMEQLMANLLAKLQSVGALTDDEFEAALEEPLAFSPES